MTAHNDAVDSGFVDALVAGGLLVPGDVAGVHGAGATLADLLTRLDAWITRHGRGADTDVVRFPPVVSRATIERSGYLHTFPHLLGTVHAFEGDHAEHGRLIEDLERGAPLERHLRLTDLVLTPAACYPVYPWAAGTLPQGGRSVDVESWCFRQEPSRDPGRLRAFRMRELVRIGAPDVVRAWRDEWINRGAELLRALGLEPVVSPASDPFFGRGGRMMAASQQSQRLKYELSVPVGSASIATAVISCNAHLDHFGELFDIRLDAHSVAHTACVAFGMQRLALALIRAHGPDPAAWPRRVREQLWEG